jgi:hypothetical protein
MVEGSPEAAKIWSIYRVEPTALISAEIFEDCGLSLGNIVT